jgi:prefoldin subunit 5
LKKVTGENTNSIEQDILNNYAKQYLYLVGKIKDSLTIDMTNKDKIAVNKLIDEAEKCYDKVYNKLKSKIDTGNQWSEQINEAYSKYDGINKIMKLQMFERVNFKKLEIK